MLTLRNGAKMLPNRRPETGLNCFPLKGSVGCSLFLSIDIS